MGKLERKLSSSQMIILGFAAVILLGALLLMLPVSSKSGEITPFLDCLLTSTSAVCVTGLVVYDTAAHWTVFGQAIIIVLIQIGGMGVITVAAAITMAAPRWKSVEATANLRLPPTSRVCHNSTARSLAGLHALFQTSMPSIGVTSYRKSRL